MNDYSDLRQEAQLAALKGFSVTLPAATLLQLIDDLVEAEEKLGDANDERIEDEEKLYAYGDLRDAVNDALIALREPEGDSFEEILGKAIEILEGA